MLLKINRFGKLSIANLLSVYSESLRRKKWRDESDLLDDFRLFFACKGAFLAQWVYEDVAVSAVRIEPYKDGYLFSCLETDPDFRRKGFAKTLISAVIADTPAIYYAHVEKSNKASLRLHKELGFTVYQDYAVFVDGSVYTNSVTLRK